MTDDPVNSAQGGHPDRLPEMRASDADREQVAERLRESSRRGRLEMTEFDERLDAAYRARTYGELAPLTRDLPPAAPSGGVPARPRTSPRGPGPGPPGSGAPPPPGAPSPSSAASAERGRWSVSRVFTAFTLCGGGDIDLRDADFEDREIVIRCFPVMGGVGVVVPPDLHVEVTGVGFMGGFDDRGAGEGTPAPEGADHRLRPDGRRRGETEAPQREQNEQAAGKVAAGNLSRVSGVPERDGQGPTRGPGADDSGAAHERRRTRTRTAAAAPFAYTADDEEKRRGVRRMKATATALLLLVAVVYALATWAEASGVTGWPGYVAAAAEAGMVGALADWFAVTALFRRPLGLPIPHTAIIPTKKDQLGESLGRFVGENFLSADVVAPASTP